MKKFLIIIVMVVLSMISSNLVHARTMSDIDSLLSECPSYVRFLKEDVGNIVELELSDEEFNSIAGTTLFIINKYQLQDNDPLVKELRDVVIPMANREKWQLAGVHLRSSASPDGPYSFNKALAIKRCQALYDFLDERLSIPPVENSVVIESKSEDYDFLISLMKKAGDDAADRVEEMKKKANGNVNVLKANLQKADGGRLWRRLLRTYYPTLRSARVVLYFKVYEPKMYIPEPIISVPADTIAKVEPTPKEPEPEPQTVTIRRAPALAIKSNILYDAFYMPNFGWAPSPDIELEYFPRNGKFSYIAALTFPYWHKWDQNKFFQIRDYRFEARYNFYPLPWLRRSRKASFSPFLGVSINNNIYGIGFNKKKGWQGEGLGASVTGGFVHRLGKDSRWRMEYVIGLGYYETRFDPYVYGNPITNVEDGDYYYDYTGDVVNFHRRNHRRRWFGPTQLGVKISYDLLFYKERHRGVGFRKTEIISTGGKEMAE